MPTTDVRSRGRGKIYRLIRELSDVVKENFEVWNWHHSTKNALPINITHDVYSERMLVPDDERDLIYIIALECVLAHANWQLIEYISKPIQTFESVN